ncbi:MAG: LLM class flavin-dependent oxidoreductase [Myxococcales bacterium]|nr:LLM class flavin-dependent oxidoreductase [Myxococcales bacterium]
MTEPDRLQLGIFMPSCRNLMSISTYKPDPDDWTYAANRRIAIEAEKAGFDFIFPVSRWMGFGGECDYMGDSLETMTWAAGLLEATSTLQVYSTVHVPVFNPVVAAKMGATLDHLSGGRWGINIVSGWNKPEFDMMGIDMLPHEDRYRRTADFIRCLKGLWTEPPGTFNFESPNYTIRGGTVRPQPQRKPHPPIVNAGQSEAARDTVTSHCDWCFICPMTWEAAEEITIDVKARARKKGRDVKVVCAAMCLWDDDPSWAERERERLIAGADRVATKNWFDTLGVESGSFGDHTYEHFAFTGGALPIMGTRSDVVDGFAKLSAMGVDGILMTFLRYEQDTARTGTELIPLLREAGLRA